MTGHFRHLSLNLAIKRKGGQRCADPLNFSRSLKSGELHTNRGRLATTHCEANSAEAEDHEHPGAGFRNRGSAQVGGKACRVSTGPIVTGHERDRVDDTEAAEIKVDLAAVRSLELELAAVAVQREVNAVQRVPVHKDAQQAVVDIHQARKQAEEARLAQGVDVAVLARRDIRRARSAGRDPRGVCPSAVPRDNVRGDGRPVGRDYCPTSVVVSLNTQCRRSRDRRGEDRRGSSRRDHHFLPHNKLLQSIGRLSFAAPRFGVGTSVVNLDAPPNQTLYLACLSRLLILALGMSTPEGAWLKRQDHSCVVWPEQIGHYNRWIGLVPPICALQRKSNLFHIGTHNMVN